MWGLGDPRLEVAATVATLVLLVVSRFALLPSGPWEWDETLFARGLLKFDLPSHFPHPPGFPLWMALGWAMLRLVGDPLRGFQLLSAAASCLAVFPLAALGRRVAPAPVAARPPSRCSSFQVCGCTRGGGSPTLRRRSSRSGPRRWPSTVSQAGVHRFHAARDRRVPDPPDPVAPPRPAVGRRGAPVRPVRRLVPGVTLGLAAYLRGRGRPGPGPGELDGFASSFVAHATTHARNLVEHNPGGSPRPRDGQGSGGAMVCSRSRGARPARHRRLGATGGPGWRAWAAILVVTVVQLVWLQNRRFSRYAVPLDMALAPLLAGVASAAAPPIVAAGTLAALGRSGAPAAFRLWSSSTRPRYPVGRPCSGRWWRRIERCRPCRGAGALPLSFLPGPARPTGGPSVEVQVVPGSLEPDSKELPSGRYLLVTNYPFHYFGSLDGEVVPFPTVSERLRPLTQGRFLNVALFPEPGVAGAGLVAAGGRGGAREVHVGWSRDGDAGSPAPGRRDARSRLRPLSRPGASRRRGQRRGRRDGAGRRAPRRALALDARLFSTEHTNRLVFRRAEGYIPGASDSAAFRSSSGASPSRVQVHDPPPGGPGAFSREVLGVLRSTRNEARIPAPRRGFIR